MNTHSLSLSVNCSKCKRMLQCLDHQLPLDTCSLGSFKYTMRRCGSLVSSYYCSALFLFPLNDFSTADLNAPPAENVCMPCNHLNVVAREIQKLKLVQILQHHHYHVAAKMRENCVRIWKEKQLHVIRFT